MSSHLLKQSVIDIAHRLKDNTMSFIIGAGFSKNISPLYMSWWELMQDMVKEMYVKDISFHNLSTDDIIKKVGYLGIASEYVRRKGYHEAIDKYIEERTPILRKQKNGKVQLWENRKLIDEDVDVSTHYALLNLGARYIYTFNYDNALEYNEDRVETESDKDCLRKVSDSLMSLNSFIEEYEDKADRTINARKEHAQDGVSLNIDLNSMVEELNSSLYIEGISLQRHHLGTLIKEIRKNREILHKGLTEKNAQKSQLESSTSQKYAVVCNSKDIIKSGYQNCIFKLHGSLRRKGDIYGFDEDTHLQYIICKEDYDTYAIKHEAFVDLMRISLLREAFCIIGFSCDDPNFLLWMNWVKDINDRSHEVSYKHLPKYYINVDDNNLPADKQLMLENHGVEVIDLAQLYDAQTYPTRKERLLRFFDDLRKFKQSDNLLDEVKIKNRSSLEPSEMEVLYDDDIVNRDWETKTKFPYPILIRKWDDYIREDIMDKMLQKLTVNSLTPSDFKLWILAYSEQNLSYINVVHDNEKKLLKTWLNQYSDLRSRYADIELIAAHVRGKNATYGEYADINVKAYVDILDNLLNFNFKDAKEKLEQWNVLMPYHKLVKMLLQATFYGVTFSDNEVQKLVDEIIASDDDQLVYTSLQLLEYTRPSNTFSQDPGHVYNIIDKHIKKMQSRGSSLIRWHDYIRTLYKAVSPEYKPEPLGNIVTRIGFSDTKIHTANQLIMMLVKGGLLPVMNGQELISKEKWIKFVRYTYGNYPAFCLMATTLYSDKNLAERIGQLYAYSPYHSVRESLSTLLVSILRELRNNMLPERLMDSLYTVCRYLVKVVPSDKWMAEYKQLFIDNDWINDKSGFYKQDRHFAVQALAYVFDDIFCNDIIEMCLSFGNNMTDYQNRLIISAKEGIEALSTKNISTLYKWMKSDTTNIQSYVILNLRHYLYEDEFQYWIHNMSDTLLSDDITLEAVCAYIKDITKEETERLSKIIANNTRLWSNGIRSDKGNGFNFDGGRALNLNEIDRYFAINEKEVVSIYEKLKLSFSQVKPHCYKGSFALAINNWDRLVRSMLCFLIRHKEVLSKANDYEQTYTDCLNLFHELRDNKSIAERLASSEDDDVQNAVIDLFQAVMVNGINQYAYEYQILANTIIYKRTKALETCLDHFSWIIGEHKNFFSSKSFIRSVILILNAFEPYFIGDGPEEWIIEADKDSIEKDILRLCYWLKEQGENIGQWNDYKPMFTMSKSKSN